LKWPMLDRDTTRKSPSLDATRVKPSTGLTMAWTGVPTMGGSPRITRQYLPRLIAL
jgi:hypothetical protein